MHTMTMPGFTAEASLYKTIQHYPGVATGAASTPQVMPQQFPPGLCRKAAYYCNRGYPNWCRILDRFCAPLDF